MIKIAETTSKSYQISGPKSRAAILKFLWRDKKETAPQRGAVWSFFNRTESGAVVAVPVHLFGPHGRRTDPDAHLPVQGPVDHHGLQRLRMLRHIQKLVFLPLEVAVPSRLQLLHQRSAERTAEASNSPVYHSGFSARLAPVTMVRI